MSTVNVRYMVDDVDAAIAFYTTHLGFKVGTRAAPAFAAQALAVLRDLGLPDDAEHVNPNGGAIALGHPLGMSGARLAATATTELGLRGGRYALCTMCIGVGQGLAVLLERV